MENPEFHVSKLEMQVLYNVLHKQENYSALFNTTVLQKMKDDIQLIAAAYYNLLMRIDWGDPVFVSGIKEGKNKFLSNAWLSLTKRNKYHKTNWISAEALSKRPS